MSKTVTGALLALTITTVSSQALEVLLEVETDIGITNDYVWRGETQTDGGPAIQGGINATNGGAYVGVWGSNVKDDTEVDVYGGYTATTESGISIDVGAIRYEYLNDPDAAAAEGYVGLGVAGVEAYVYEDLDTASRYYTVGTSVLELDVAVGYNEEDFDYTVSKSFDDFSVGVTHKESGDTGFTVSFGVSF